MLTPSKVAVFTPGLLQCVKSHHLYIQTTRKGKSRICIGNVINVWLAVEKYLNDPI